MAGAVGSTALGSRFGASLEDHDPNVVLHRAGSQTARRTGSLRGHDHSRQAAPAQSCYADVDTHRYSPVTAAIRYDSVDR